MVSTDLGLEAFVDPDEPIEDWEFAAFAFWDRGHTRAEFEDAPIPYILAMFKILKYYDDKAKKEMPKT